MNLKLQRKLLSTNSTTGVLYINGAFAAFTLEPQWKDPPWKQDGSKPRAIPPGTYAVTVRWSQKHKRNVPHIESVPGFTQIEIHAGNYPSDTEGCVLVGGTIGEDYVGESQIAFHEIYNKVLLAIEDGEQVDITVVNPDAASAG